jgi:flagellar hook assembly protein FlgD
MTNDVELSIYNLLGEKVAVLVSEKQTAGRYQIEWDASAYSSGVYYYQLVAEDYREVKKMLFLK